MAEQDDEREVSRVYRQLPREEPPPEIDAAIRAEARSAIETHPAPLVVPTGRRNWYFPLAASAVIVLAVAVTWHVEQEQPDPAVAPPAKVPSAPAPKADAQPKGQAQPRAPAQGSRPELSRERTARSDAPRPAQTESSTGALSAQSGPRADALAKLDSPESQLQRIAELRAQGKHEEADKALADFRRRHPDYVIAPAMLEKVEKK
jgi:hypothetical protein